MYNKRYFKVDLSYFYLTVVFAPPEIILFLSQFRIIDTVFSLIYIIAHFSIIAHPLGKQSMLSLIVTHMLFLERTENVDFEKVSAHVGLFKRIWYKS